MRIIKLPGLLFVLCLISLSGYAAGLFSTYTPPAYWKAVADGNLNEVRRYIDEGYDVNMTYRNNVTSLHIAALQGHFHLIRYLIEHGAHINALSSEGETALSIAARENNLSIAEYLLNHKADIRAGNPLFEAVASQHYNATVFLIGREANVNQPGPDGLSPLHIAVTRQNVDIVRLLLQHGARPGTVCIVGNLAVRPIDIAHGLQNNEIMELLTQPKYHENAPALGSDIALASMDCQRIRAIAEKALKDKYSNIDFSKFRPGYIICMAHENAPVNNPVVAEWYGSEILATERGHTKEKDRLKVLKLKVIMSKYGEVEDITRTTTWLYRNAEGGLD